MRITVLIVLSCLLIFGLALAEDKIIAIVNNEIITQKDLNDFTHFMRMQLSEEDQGKNLESKINSLKGDMLDKLIEDRLILQEAKKSNIKLDQNQIKARVQEIKKRYGSETAFAAALSGQGLVEADIIQKISEQLLMYTLIQGKVRDNIVVNPDEVTQFYQKNKGQLKLPPKRELTAITIDSESKAKEITGKLKAKNTLEELSEKYSLKINRMIAQRGELRKDIEDVVFKLKPLEVSSPVKIEDSYYVFRLDRIIVEREPSLSEAQENIYRYIYDKKMQENLTKWLNGLKEKAFIKVL